MQLTFIIVGGLVGMLIAASSDAFLGFGAGAALGYLLAQLRSLQDRVKELSARIERSPEIQSPAEPRPGVAESPWQRPLDETPATPVPTVQKAVGQPAPATLSPEPPTAPPRRS